MLGNNSCTELNDSELMEIDGGVTAYQIGYAIGEFIGVTAAILYCVNNPAGTVILLK